MSSMPATTSLSLSGASSMSSLSAPSSNLPGISYNGGNIQVTENGMKKNIGIQDQEVLNKIVGEDMANAFTTEAQATLKAKFQEFLTANGKTKANYHNFNLEFSDSGTRFVFFENEDMNCTTPKFIDLRGCNKLQVTLTDATRTKTETVAGVLLNDVSTQRIIEADLEAYKIPKISGVLTNSMITTMATRITGNPELGRAYLVTKGRIQPAPIVALAPSMNGASLSSSTSSSLPSGSSSVTTTTTGTDSSSSSSASSPSLSIPTTIQAENFGTLTYSGNSHSDGRSIYTSADSKSRFLVDHQQRRVQPFQGNNTNSSVVDAAPGALSAQVEPTVVIVPVNGVNGAHSDDESSDSDDEGSLVSAHTTNSLQQRQLLDEREKQQRLASEAAASTASKQSQPITPSGLVNSLGNMLRRKPKTTATVAAPAHQNGANGVSTAPTQPVAKPTPAVVTPTFDSRRFADDHRSIGNGSSSSSSVPVGVATSAQAPNGLNGRTTNANRYTRKKDVGTKILVPVQFEI